MMSRPIRTTRQSAKGVALIMVLGLIMAITVLSLGFLTRSQTEMACGENMALRMQMDQAAVSALEHARGLLLNPPDSSLAEGYWTGATAQQLVSGSNDYYDVNVAADAADHCNYHISCQAYRLENAERIGLSTLSGELRLDPSIAFWLGATTALPLGVAITGDVYCAGDLAGQGTIDGDVFADGGVTGLSPTGRTKASVTEPPLAWPGIGVGNYSPSYQVGATGYSPATLNAATHATGNFGPASSNPGGVRYRNGDITLPGNVSITGLLVVDGDLRITGSDNAITAVQGFPALLVSGDLIVEPGGHLTVNGQAIIGGLAQISADAGVVAITGGILVGDSLRETAWDASGNGLTGTVYGAAAWSPTAGQSNGALQLDGVDDYVDCGTSVDFVIINKITLAAWVKTNEAGNGEHDPFVTKGDRTYALKHNAGNTIEFFVYDPVAQWCSVAYPVGSSFNGQWHHVAGTYDGTEAKLYIDGVLRDTNVRPGIINHLNYSVNIGRNAQEPDRFYNGAIDDVRIYARALDATEILQLHDHPGLLGDTTELRARYEFDEVGSSVTLTADPRRTAFIIWDWDGATSTWKGTGWSQAAGAFFKSVRRQ